MATKNIPWATGTGNITVVYDGSGNGSIVVTSDANTLHEARSQNLIVKTTKGGTVKKTITVAQAMKPYIDLSNAVVTAANQTYSGSAQTPTPTVKLNGVTVPSTGYDVDYSNNTNAGTATITITGKGDYTGTATGTFTIAKAASSLTSAPTAKSSLTYSGSSKALVNAGSASGGTVYYQATTTNSKPSSTSGFSSSIPTGTNAGTYYVWYYVKGDSNHTDTAISSTAVSVSIARASRTLSFSSPTTVVQTSSSVINTATPSAGSGDGTITYSISSTTYATIGSSTGKVTAKTSEGSATVTATISQGTNYNAASASYTINVVQYNTSGLVFMLDGKMKGSDTSNWTDLVGGTLFPYGSVATKSTNYVSFSGSGGIKVAKSVSFPDSSYTIEIVAEKTTGGTVIQFGKRNVIAMLQDTKFSYSSTSASVYYPLATDRMFSANRDRCMINGRVVYASGTDYWTPRNGYICIGDSAAGAYPFSGKIYSIRVYNRKLSESEMRSNQTIDNTRFGFGIHVDNSYISDGLVFQLDGINKGSDTSNWTDQIGGIKFPYGSYATKGTNYVLFDGAGSLQVTASKSFLQTTHTIEVAADRPQANKVLFYPAAKGEIMWAYMGIANQTLIDKNLMTIEWGTNSAAGWRVSRDAKMVSVNADRSIGDGTAGAAASNDSWSAQIDGKYKIGGRNTDYLYSGKVYAIRIYSRKLSASEIMQNQRLDNNRFGFNKSM